LFADSCKLVVRNAQSAGLASPTISAPFPSWFLSPCCTNGRCKKTAPTQGGELRPPCLEAMPCRERPGTTLIVSLQVAGAIKFCFTVPSPCCAGPFFFSPLVVPTHGSTHKLHPALRESPVCSLFERVLIHDRIGQRRGERSKVNRRAADRPA
jgi:hypothetical protein